MILFASMAFETASWGDRGKAAVVVGALLLTWWIIATFSQKKADRAHERALRNAEQQGLIIDARDEIDPIPQHPANRLSRQSRQVS